MNEHRTSCIRSTRAGPRLATALLLTLTGTACDLEIEPTVAGQAVIDANDERCSISQEAADGLQYAVNAGAVDGSKYRQFRITMTNQEFGLCTAAQVRPELGVDTMRMNAAGFLSRFGIALPITGVSVSGIVTTDDCPQDGVSLSNAFVECLDDDRLNTSFVVTAPHGGNIERFTDLQAEYVRTELREQNEDVSLWTCKGWHSNGAKDHWHITSNDIGTQSFPKLDSISTRNFTNAVSFHGSGVAGKVIHIGGNAGLTLKQTLRQNILNETGNAVTVIIGGGANPGVGADNFVNWLTANGTGGVQLEQSLDARTDHWEEIAQGVVETFD